MLKKWIASTHFLYFSGLLVIVPLIVRGFMKNDNVEISDFGLLDIIWVFFCVISICILWNIRANILKTAIRELPGNSDDDIEMLCSIALAESYYSRSAMSPLAAQSIDKISTSKHRVLSKKIVAKLHKVHSVACWRWGYPKIVDEFEKYLGDLEEKSKS